MKTRLLIIIGIILLSSGIGFISYNLIMFLQYPPEDISLFIKIINFLVMIAFLIPFVIGVIYLIHKGRKKMNISSS